MPLNLILTNWEVLASIRRMYIIDARSIRSIVNKMSLRRRTTRCDHENMNRKWHKLGHERTKMNQQLRIWENKYKTQEIREFTLEKSSDEIENTKYSKIGKKWTRRRCKQKQMDSGSCKRLWYHDNLQS